MAELSKITLPSGTTYDVKDAGARNSIQALAELVGSGIRFISATTADTIPKGLLLLM